MKDLKESNTLNDRETAKIPQYLAALVGKCPLFQSQIFIKHRTKIKWNWKQMFNASFMVQSCNHFIVCNVLKEESFFLIYWVFLGT